MIGLSFTLRVGRPIFSRLFALMNDQNSRDIHGRWVFALVLQCGMVLFISVVRLSRKKVQFVLTSCEFGSESKYSSVSSEMLFLSLHQSADLYLNTL